jgi:hypothetical protein
MAWSTEYTLALITLPGTIPTLLISILAIIRRWRNYFRGKNTYSAKAFHPMSLTLNLSASHPTQPGGMLSPNSLHASQFSLLSSFQVIRMSHIPIVMFTFPLLMLTNGLSNFESYEVRRPTCDAWQKGALIYV